MQFMQVSICLPCGSEQHCDAPVGSIQLVCRLLFLLSNKMQNTLTSMHIEQNNTVLLQNCRPTHHMQLQSENITRCFWAVLRSMVLQAEANEGIQMVHAHLLSHVGQDHSQPAADPCNLGGAWLALPLCHRLQRPAAGTGCK